LLWIDEEHIRRFEGEFRCFLFRGDGR